MTAKQKAARAKFKAVVAEAKKLRKKNPKLTQAQAVKQAFAISYSKSPKKKAAKKSGKKVAAIKLIEKGESKKTKPKATYQVKRTAKGTYKGLKKVGAVKKKAATKSEYHKDTKSHNVRISVMSGISKQALDDYEKLQKRIEIAKFKILFNDEQAKLSKKNTLTKMAFLKNKVAAQKYLKELETHARELKKHI